MGLFGGQTKMDVRTESPVVVNEESQFDNTPGLPKPSSTVVAGGVTVTGTIKGEGVVQVEGVVEGEIVLTGAVVVSSSGLIRGPISADVVRVAGRSGRGRRGHRLPCGGGRWAAQWPFVYD